LQTLTINSTIDSMAYDIIIKSGTVIDGKNAPVLGDVAIEGDKIVAVKSLGEASAKVVINAFGKYVTPGFVDITNHSDTHLTLFKYPYLESLVMQGVTTIIGGNCGASLAPLASEQAIGAIKKWADPSEINVNWNTVEEFLSSISQLRPGVNFGTLAGYGTLRRGILSGEMRPLSIEEREKLKLLLLQSMQQGAFGLSLGLAYGHERVSVTEEIIEIGRVVSQTGGIIKMHLRSEGFEILSSVNEAIRICRETGVPVQISHLKAIGRKAWPFLPKAIELITHAKESGVDIDFDVTPYRTTGSLLYLLVPPGARQGGFQELFRRIDNPPERTKILEALRGHTLHYDKILITSAKIKNIVGHTLTEIAEEAGLTPEETLLETIRSNEGRVTIVGQMVSMKNTRMALQDKNSFIASDGAGVSQDEMQTGDLVHPRSFGAFPRFLGRFTKELGISMQDAIGKITSGPAKKLGIKGRGVLEKGAFADVVVFDPKLIRDRATYKNPFRFSSGIEWVLVNGIPAVENGKLVQARAGKAIKRV